MTSGEYICHICCFISHLPIASRSNFPHTLLMALAQRTSRKSTPTRMRPFVRIPPLSQQKRRRTGRPKARNTQQIVSLLSNVKPKSRQRSRLSKPMVEMPRTRTKKRTKSNWHFSSATLFYASSCHSRSRLCHIFMCAYPNPREDHARLCLVLTTWAVPYTEGMSHS